jgi:hypothetical protein
VEGEVDRALKYALGGVTALAGDDGEGVAEVVAAVREQILVAARKLASTAKAAGRAEQVRTAESHRQVVHSHSDICHNFCSFLL